MGYSTGENEPGLRKILDFTRFASMLVLLLHFFYFFYGWFLQWPIFSRVPDRFLLSLARTGIFINFNLSKWIPLGLLFISLLGIKGKKEESFTVKGVLAGFFSGLCIYFSGNLLLDLPLSAHIVIPAYIFLTGTGYLLVLRYGTRIGRLLTGKLPEDIFNDFNESFPQEERDIRNAYSVNLPARYRIKGKFRQSRINLINPFRGLIVTGSPGSGKSWFVIQHIIKQHIEKGFAMLVYDFKYDDLSRIAYNWLQKFKSAYPVPPGFYVINFDDLSISHRCNPMDPAAMHDITDATESARTMLLGLNREWIHKQGDFFVESPINFLTAVIWFLRKYKDGKYCTLPHVIELMQTDYEDLFSVLNTEPEIEVLINPFVTAYQNDAMEQLEGQVASAKIGMARLASPPLYWVLSGNDFGLDINNPAAPKIVCMGNNPEKQQIYGAVLSLYIARLVRQINKKNRLKCSLVFDEFPTIFFNHIDSLIATARSNKVATTLAMQDFSQLKKDYGKDHAEVIVNITGNIISGQVMGETARLLSDRFGKIQQRRQSFSINATDTSFSNSMQLDSAIPPSRISQLSAGEFVGMIADDVAEKVKLKRFYAEILNDPDLLKKEEALFEPIPISYPVTEKQITENYYRVKSEIKTLIREELAKLKAVLNHAAK